MNRTCILLLLSLTALTGCETLQTPAQRQQAQVREKNSRLYTEEQIRRLRGQIEAMEMENARQTDELQRLRQEIGSSSAQMATLSNRMASLESKQKQEMNNLIREVKTLLNKAVTTTARNTPPPRGAGREHVVEAGHTLSAIAQAYGTTVKAIKQANNLKSDNIYVGQKLFIPE